MIQAMFEDGDGEYVWKDKPTSQEAQVTPTHAGMICFNRAGQVLLCNAKGKPEEWVLPKGHIENSESSDEAAVRETLEETGVESLTDMVEPLALSEFDYEGEHIILEWWTGLAIRISVTREPERMSKWVSWGRALKMLTYEGQRDAVRKALSFRE